MKTTKKKYTLIVSCTAPKGGISPQLAERHKQAIAKAFSDCLIAEEEERSVTRAIARLRDTIRFATLASGDAKLATRAVDEIVEETVIARGSAIRTFRLGAIRRVEKIAREQIKQGASGVLLCEHRRTQNNVNKLIAHVGKKFGDLAENEIATIEERNGKTVTKRSFRLGDLAPFRAIV